jgi:hypothetical protein
VPVPISRRRKRKPDKAEGKRKAEGTREGAEGKRAGKARGGGGGGGRSADTMRKNERGGGGCQVISEREEREGVTVTGGATGGHWGGRTGDRTREERDGRGATTTRPRQNGQEGEMCSVEKEAKEALPYRYAQSGQLHVSGLDESSTLLLYLKLL